MDFGKIADLLFPKRCLACGCSHNNYLCPSCRRSLLPVKIQRCPICEKSSFAGITHSSCRTRYSLDGGFSLYVYDRLWKKIISEIKFRLVREATDYLGRELAIKLRDCPLAPRWKSSHFIFVPVPIHYLKFKWRGFNQSEEILKSIGARLGLPLELSLVKRTRLTKSQAGLSQKLRKNNISGAFAVNENKTKDVREKNFVVFDDIWTTGTTIKELAKTLKKAGAGQVWGLTICR